MYGIVIETEEEIREKKKLRFRTEMTSRQFKAFAYKLNNANIEDEIISLKYFKDGLSSARSLDLKNIEMWLKNSWNTENVLFYNKSIIQDTGQSFSMQWAFPQAYYSTFCSILAYYKSVGFPQMSHSGLLKEFGNLLSENKYPKSISMYTSGSIKAIEYNNIIKPKIKNTFDLDLRIPETIDNQICQALKTTREDMSKKKAPKMKFKTKKKKPRKKLTPHMWNKVSDAIGYTTIMDFLYRKRIKANYLDIETFSAKEFKGEEVLNNLCTIVNRLNLTNEVYIAKAISIDQYEIMLKKHLSNVNNNIVRSRFKTIKEIFSR